ncbi:hypothetical protein QBZ16_001757 [Prototheca wickerhamii]|uniref:Uncharacterized protein n=1 Tax=Prototheca wickerhamii TaxID=3111 RepID=A0AAD9ID30_PROWI|nr:hypothetical protein QBZ16_001757 [Prototheca wickerhamii]
MDSRPPQPSQLARILCECLESSLISEDAPKAPRGDDDPIIAYFGNFLRSGYPRLALLSPHSTLAGLAISQERPVLASAGYANEHGYDDLAAPMSVAVPFVYAPGAVAGREEEEEESARSSAVLILGAATREAAASPPAVRHLMQLAAALQRAEGLHAALAPFVRHVSLLLETQGAEDADPALAPADEGSDGGDGPARVAGSLADGAAPSFAAWRSRRDADGDVVGAKELGTSSKCCADGDADSEATAPEPSREDAEAARLAHWRAANLGHLDGLLLTGVAAALASDALGGGGGPPSWAMRLAVGAVGACGLLAVAWRAGTTTPRAAAGRAPQQLPRRDNILAAVHVLLSLWVMGGAQALAAAAGRPRRADAAPAALSAPTAAWLTSALLLRQTCYAGLARGQMVVASLAAVSTSLYLSPAGDRFGLLGCAARLLRVGAGTLALPLLVDRVINGAVKRSLAAAERGGGGGASQRGLTQYAPLVFFGFFDPDKLRTNVYNVQPDLVTDLQGRTFAVWTLTSCVLCLICARNPCIPAIYGATLASFAIALVHFIVELLVFKTLDVTKALQPGVIATVSVLWMSLGWKYYTSFVPAAEPSVSEEVTVTKDE